MPKQITSPVKRWPGTVTISDPLTFPQVLKLEAALSEVRGREEVSKSEVDALLLPALLECVQEWRLENFPQGVNVDNFPATPRRPSAELIAWLLTEVTELYVEAEAVPLG